MKKVLYIAVLIAMVGIGSRACAQNSTEIVRHYLEFRNIPPSEYPQEKFEYRCNFSRNSFYMCDTVPQGALVFNISELTNFITKQHPSENYVVDLEVFSYWAWDFLNFQKQDYTHTIYFDTHNATNRYLAVRSWDEAYSRTALPERWEK
jgi:hypothetical protein